ncbi:glucose-1-phosphate cytidylyltransferase [Flaviflagellibacter deserti]|uniref:Glucose-1-phosphate cytidylyltransferase n=1 Tax=Flaviflagellibacter deserti TaxID=2267266 RepID=A0ABV9Z547_9HYPH
MKVVILAGGLGTRISEESHLRPKPLIEIGGRPILWHIMKRYSHCGYNDFIICAGYKGYMIKEFFLNYFAHRSDITVDLTTNSVEFHQSFAEPWRVTIVDTGEATLTGGRLKRIRHHLVSGEPFFMTYGDGVADIDLTEELAFHKRNGRQATLAGVIPPGRYGALDLAGDEVMTFIEKPPGDNARINGGFFVLETSVLDRIEGDQTSFEGDVLNSLARDRQLSAYPHNGFWQPMDTLRDKNHLEALWSAGQAPWKV